MAIRRPREESPNAINRAGAAISKFSPSGRTSRVFADSSAADFPQLMSDAQFAAELEERECHERQEYDRWNPVTGQKPVSDGLPESTLEQSFPHIARKLSAIWPSDACAEYINSLLVVEREARQGFPASVVEDLLMLHAMNEMLMRKIALTSFDVWSGTSPRK
jgi:hypothetical protein